MAAVALDSILRTAALPQMPPRPVVLLHGFASTPRMLAFLARQIRVRLECPVLRPALGFGWGDVLNVATCVDAAIAAAGFGAVDVVGHSLGGLVATVLLKHIDRGSRVRRVITLGTPHRGCRSRAMPRSPPSGCRRACDSCARALVSSPGSRRVRCHADRSSSRSRATVTPLCRNAPRASRRRCGSARCGSAASDTCRSSSIATRSS